LSVKLIGGSILESKNVMTVPAKFMQGVKKELQGSLVDVEYSVKNYINLSRQLVTDQNISSKEAGRETVSGDALTKKCNVYLPAGYDKNDSGTRYNVLYLLHGVGGPRYKWLDGSGKADGVTFEAGFEKAVEGLSETAGDYLPKNEINMFLESNNNSVEGEFYGKKRI
jgi:hypothetical protein